MAIRISKPMNVADFDKRLSVGSCCYKMPPERASSQWQWDLIKSIVLTPSASTPVSASSSSSFLSAPVVVQLLAMRFFIFASCIRRENLHFSSYFTLGLRSYILILCQSFTKISSILSDAVVKIPLMLMHLQLHTQRKFVFRPVACSGTRWRR